MTVFIRYNAYMHVLCIEENSKENLLQCSQEEETYYIYSLPPILWKVENTKVFVLHYLRQVCISSIRKLYSLHWLKMSVALLQSTRSKYSASCDTGEVERAIQRGPLYSWKVWDSWYELCSLQLPSNLNFTWWVLLCFPVIFLQGKAKFCPFCCW